MKSVVSVNSVAAKSHQLVYTAAEKFVKFVSATACSLLDDVDSFLGRIGKVGDSLVVSCVREKHN